MFFLILIIFKSNSKKLIVPFLIFESASCLLDYNRLQPWEYQYLLTFFIFIFSNNKKQLLKLVSFLICFTYIFSGIHKLNGGFIYSVWKNMILKKIFYFDQLNHNLFVHYFGLIIPIIEISIGLGLLILKQKKYLVYLAILVHLFIIYILSPLGINYNEIVIPWNLLMIFIIIVLFYRNEIDYLKSLKPLYKLDLIIITLVCILPILNFTGYWDNYLSFNLYSGKEKKYVVQVSGIEKYPELIAVKSNSKIYKIIKNSEPIDLFTMSLSELKVPFYPERRTFIIFKQKWNQRYSSTKNRFFSFQYPFTKDKIEELK